MSKNTDNVNSIPNESLVKVTTMNHLVEVQYMEKRNYQSHIKKLDKDRFVVISTGEIKEVEHTSNRKQNLDGLRKSFKKIRNYINNNFVGASNELHVTLTYAENMTDTKRLYKDFDNFRKRLITYFKKKNTSIDYINVIEPQGRGAWHCHLLIRCNDVKKIYVPNDELAKVWGHGFITIKSLAKIDNIGAYLSAYLADIELNDDNLHYAVQNESSITIREVDGQEKKFIKGGRLHLYPTGMNILRTSKGILAPESEMMSYKRAKKIVKSGEPHFKKVYDIENETFSNKIIYEQYNLKRDK